METSSPIIVADSSGLISLTLETDLNHEAAMAIANDFVGTQTTALIPAEVFAETLNILGKKFGHERAVEASEAILGSAVSSWFPQATSSDWMPSSSSAPCRLV
jgi:predicted nucleic acid-binding protein